MSGACAPHPWCPAPQTFKFAKINVYQQHFKLRQILSLSDDEKKQKQRSGWIFSSITGCKRFALLFTTSYIKLSWYALGGVWLSQKLPITPPCHSFISFCSWSFHEGAAEDYYLLLLVGYYSLCNYVILQRVPCINMYKQCKQCPYHLLHL